MFAHLLVKVPPAASAEAAGQHAQLALVEAGSGHLGPGVAAVNKHNVPAGLVWLGQVLLVNTVGQCRGCCVIHQFEHVEATHLGAVQQGSPLSISEVGGDRDDTIIDLDVKGCLRCLLELGEQSGRELLCGQLLALPVVVDVVGGDPSLTLDNLKGNTGQLGLDLGIIKFPAYKIVDSS